MKPSFINIAIAGSLLAIMAAGPALAQVTGAASGTRAGNRGVANLIMRAEENATREITRRVDSLNALTTRVNAMVRVTAEEKNGLTAEIQNQITALRTLQTQVQNDASAGATSSLKADIQSITKSYRIYMLVMPQANIEAAADRAMTVAGMLSTLAGKLAERTSSSTPALADMNAKITDANTQAQTAVNEVASLQPDNGNQTVAQSNTTALKDARKKIQAAQQDLVAARKDAWTIIKGLIGSAPAAATSTATGTSQ